jgi:hypothetical protein
MPVFRDLGARKSGGFLAADVICEFTAQAQV